MEIIEGRRLLAPMGEITFWNVRGLNASVRQYDVKQLIHRSRVKIACLIETRVKEQKKEEVLRKISNLNSIDNYDYDDDGRIWILWNQQCVQIQRIEGSNQYLHCRVEIGEDKFQLTVVYAKNTDRERESLWPALTNLAHSLIAWMNEEL